MIVVCYYLLFIILFMQLETLISEMKSFSFLLVSAM